WWDRIIYVDMSGQDGDTVAFPLYYRLGKESLYAISQRPLDAFKLADPRLIDAPLSGWNALWRIGTHTGIVLAALGYQITEATHLLTHPTAWLSRLTEAASCSRETAMSASFFIDEFSHWPKEKQVSLTEALRTKIELLTTDVAMRALVGAPQPGINWQ